MGKRRSYASGWDFACAGVVQGLGRLGLGATRSANGNAAFGRKFGAWRGARSIYRAVHRVLFLQSVCTYESELFVRRLNRVSQSERLSILIAIEDRPVVD